MLEECGSCCGTAGRLRSVLLQAPGMPRLGVLVAARPEAFQFRPAIAYLFQCSWPLKLSGTGDQVSLLSSEISAQVLVLRARASGSFNGSCCTRKCMLQDALEATVPVEQYIDAEVARTEKWLLGETFHDALTEVMAIKLNVLQAFRQSAAHPDDAHFGLDDALSDDDYAQDPVETSPRTEAHMGAVLGGTS